MLRPKPSTRTMARSACWGWSARTISKADASYADKLDLGHPVAVAGERTWLDYAAREPGLVVLVSRDGKVLRGWPGGATAEQLRRPLEELIAR